MLLAGPRAALASTPLEFDHVEDGLVFLKGDAPKPITTGLHELRYLGSIRGTEAAAQPFFLFAGRPCVGCATDPAIYAIRPAGKTATFVTPGRILEPRSRALMLESRGFFGSCVPGMGEVLVMFQKERVDRKRKLQSSVFVAEATADDHLREKLLERKLPRLEDTLKRVRAKKCHELESRNRLMLNRPLDIASRRARHQPLPGVASTGLDDGTDSPDSDDESPRRNQTDVDFSPQGE